MNETNGLLAESVSRYSTPLNMQNHELIAIGLAKGALPTEPLSAADAREIMLRSIYIASSAAEFIPSLFKCDKDFMLCAVQIKGMSLEYATDDMRKQKDIVKSANNG